jgi:hypothetical protein
MTKPTSFEEDIRPLFTDRDIRGMMKVFNLASYNDVKAHGRPSTIVSGELVAR